jgi:hypothetical protein
MRYRDALFEKNPRFSLHGGKVALSVLEHIEHLLARYPFVPFQEVIYRRACFEMCKKECSPALVCL